MKKEENALLFVGITASPRNVELRKAARGSWLLPCIMNPRCDYRFFCDTTNITDALQVEQSKFGDLIFRDSCDLMTRHPKEVHYGNSPPDYKKKLPNQPDEYVHDYQYRRMYKIDWNVDPLASQLMTA